MHTQETLSIIAIVALGLCLICGLAKMAVKSDKTKKSCDDACSLLVFIAVVLVGVSQLITEDDFCTRGQINDMCASVGPNAPQCCLSGQCRPADEKRLCNLLGKGKPPCCIPPSV